MFTKKRILKNFLSLSAGELCSKILGFLVIVYLARVLGAKGFGEIGFATAILAYFLLLVNLGFDTFGIREVARESSKVSSYLGNILSLKLTCAIISFLLLSLFAYLIPKPVEIKKLIFFYGFSLFAYSLIIEWVFMGIQRMESIAISRIIRQTLYLGLIFIIVKSQDQILSVPFIYIFSTSIGAFVLLYFFLVNYGTIKLTFNFSFWREILRQSLPMGLSYMMVQIYYNFDVVMLGFLKGEEIVGWYNAAYKIILFLMVIPTLIVNVFFPILSQLYKKDLIQLKTTATTYVKILVILGLPFGVGGTILAKELIYFIYGQSYSNAILALQILIWNLVIVFLNIAYGNPLLAWDQQIRHMKCIGLGTIVNLVLNLLLIPKYSLYGASVATILAELMVFLGVYPAFQKIVKVNIINQISKPFLASVGMAISLLFLRTYGLNILVLIILGIVVYFVLLWGVKGITKSEINYILGRG